MDGTNAAQEVELGGRRFRVVTESTVEHDQWYMRHVRAAGLDALAAAEGESADELAHRLMGVAIDTGRMTLLLAGMLVPMDAPGGRWSPDLALGTAEFIAQLSDPESKRRVYGLTAALLADFFVVGLTSCGASPLSSAGQPEAPNHKGPGASGPRSSGTSRGSTLAERWRSFAGRLRRRFMPSARSSGGALSRTTATAASSGR